MPYLVNRITPAASEELQPGNGDYSTVAVKMIDQVGPIDVGGTLFLPMGPPYFNGYVQFFISADNGVTWTADSSGVQQACRNWTAEWNPTTGLFTIVYLEINVQTYMPIRVRQYDPATQTWGANLTDGMSTRFALTVNHRTNGDIIVGHENGVAGVGGGYWISVFSSGAWTDLQLQNQLGCSIPVGLPGLPLGTGEVDASGQFHFIVLWNTSFFSASYFYYRLLTNNTIDPVTNIGQPPGAGFLISPPLSTTNTSFGNVVVLDDLDCLFLPFVASVTSIAAGCLVSGLGAGVTPLLSYPSLPDTGLSYYASEFNGSSTGPCANVEVDDNLYVAYCLSFPTWGIWGFRTSKATPAGPWVDFQVLDSADSSPLVARTFDAVLHLVNGALQVFFDAEDDTTGLLGRYLLGAAGPPNPPVITCGNPPNGIILAPYTHTLPVAGGTAPFTFTLIGGSLPPSLSIGAATGTISGTPPWGGTFTFTIQVTDANALSSSVTCSIIIYGQPIRITLRGVKVRRSECPPELENVLEAPHVEKAV